MRLCDDAIDEERRLRAGGAEGIRTPVEIYAEALRLERSAIEELRAAAGRGEEVEPTLSVLCRSGACLALLAGEAEEAARLARLGLDGCKYPEIEAELLEALASAHAAGAHVSAEECEAYLHNPAELGNPQPFVAHVSECAACADLLRTSARVEAAIDAVLGGYS